jgi:hypothetical protein
VVAGSLRLLIFSLYHFGFQSIKRSKFVWPELIAFAGDWLRSSANVAEWALKEPSYGAMMMFGSDRCHRFVGQIL